MKKNNPKFIHFTLCSVSHILRSERLHHWESWDNSFFPMYIHHSIYLSLVKTLTMRDNELKSISSSLYSIPCHPPPLSPSMWKRIFIWTFFFDECVCIIWNMCIEWDEKRKRRKNVELRTWKTKKKKSFIQAARRSRQYEERGIFSIEFCAPKWLKI